MAEAQKNVPIDESYHDQLKRIAIIEKTSMKNTVQKWIKKDGRGIAPSARELKREESKQESPKQEEPKKGDLLSVISQSQTSNPFMPTTPADYNPL